tara:strand:- start:157 stop:369 length:213 start_codon:yes stop_codon:yes gene_type:complete
MAHGDKKSGISIFFPKIVVERSGFPTLAKMLGTKSQSSKDFVFLLSVISSSAPPSYNEILVKVIFFSQVF